MLATLIYLGILVVMSIVVFSLYGVDKAKAIKQKMRIRESTLLVFGVFGGAIGALFGMCIFRHKTNHTMFWVINIMALVIQLAILGVFLFFELPTLLNY